MENQLKVPDTFIRLYLYLRSYFILNPLPTNFENQREVFTRKRPRVKIFNWCEIIEGETVTIFLSKDYQNIITIFCF